MSILDDHNTIKDLAKDLRVSPPEGAWAKVQKNLVNKKRVEKRRRNNLVRFWFSIAASLMIIFTCGVIIFYETQQPPNYKKGRVESWEDLNNHADDFYSVNRVRDLTKVYNP